MTMQTGNGSWSTRARAMGLAAARGLAPALVTLPGAVLGLTLALVSIALVPIGIGLVTTPWVLTGVRALADWRRVLAAEWSGVRIPSAYRPPPPDANPWTRSPNCATW